MNKREEFVKQLNVLMWYLDPQGVLIPDLLVKKQCQLLNDLYDQANQPSQDGLPELPEPFSYPKGNIVGPCVCGSWPGGECLKCEPVNYYTADQMRAYGQARADAEYLKWEARIATMPDTPQGAPHEGGESEDIYALLGKVVKQCGTDSGFKLELLKMLGFSLAWDGKAYSAVAPTPPGYVLVPIEPTSDMMNAAPEAWNAWTRNDFGLSLQNLGIRIWRAMISAAPPIAAMADEAGKV